MNIKDKLLFLLIYFVIHAGTNLQSHSRAFIPELLQAVIFIYALYVDLKIQPIKKRKNMKIINPSHEILEITPNPLQAIELAARTCYKSEALIAEGSAEKLVARLKNSGHGTPIEFADMTVKFVTDRAVSHELVRHRLASFNQESQRYCNYASEKFDNEIMVIRPWHCVKDTDEYLRWYEAMIYAESYYLEQINAGTKPEAARLVLPNSTKTEIAMKANLREWYHILKFRTSKAAYPGIREVMIPLLHEVKDRVPIIFDDIAVEM